MDEVLHQLGDLVTEMKRYMLSAWDGIRPVIGAILGGLSTLMFPTQSYATAAKALGIAMVLDIITKYIALSAEHGGFRNAFRKGVIVSRSLWVGSVVKLFTYFIIGIMIGASYLIYASIPEDIPVIKGFAEQVIPFIGTTSYAIFFVRDVQSSLENLNDFLIATKYNDVVDIGWLIGWMSTTEKDLRETVPKQFKEEIIKNAEESEEKVGEEEDEE